MEVPRTKYIDFDEDDRTIWLHHEEIDNEVTSELIRVICYLDEICITKPVYSLPDHIFLSNREYIIATKYIEKLNEFFNTITLRINCEGGNVEDVFAIIDTIHTRKTKVNSLIEGQGLSGAALLASCVTGARFITKNSSYMLHGIKYFYQEEEKSVAQIKVEKKYFEYLVNRMCRLITENSNMKALEVRAMLEQDVDIYILPKNCVKLKLLDGII